MVQVISWIVAVAITLLIIVAFFWLLGLFLTFLDWMFNGFR